MNISYSAKRKGSCCSVPQCSMRAGTNAISDVKVFKFPKYKVRRTAWIRAVSRKNWTPSESSVVCCKHFIAGSPSSDPDHPDWVPSIFPFKRRSGKLEKKKLERYERWRERRKTTERDNADDPGVSNNKKKKKPKPTKPVDSESTSTDENCEDFPIDSSSDYDADAQVPPPPVSSIAPPTSSLIPKTEFMFVGKRSVDLNYFVSNLRRVNKHHKSLPCGISDMIICEETTKGLLHGIVFRCKMCLMKNTVWLEDPYMAAVATAKDQAYKMAEENQIKNELYSMSGIKDFLLSKPAILPKVPISRKPELNLASQSNISFVGQSQPPTIVQSHLPLFGYPQVATMQQPFLYGSGVNPTGKDTSSFTNPALVELKFCVEEPAKRENTSAKSTATSTGRRASKRIALTPSAISKRHVSYLKSAATQARAIKPKSKTAPEKITVTPDVFPRNHTSPPSAPGRIIIAPNQIHGSHILQPRSAQSRVGTAAPRRFLLTPEDLQKILSAQGSLPGQGTASKTVLPQRIIFASSQSGPETMQSAQSGIAAKEVASRSILLPPSVFAPSPQSTSAQSTGFGTSSTATMPETITPDISTHDVLPVDLNLVKKETASIQSTGSIASYPAMIVPETIAPVISTAVVLPVDLNLVKREKNETESVQSSGTSYPATIVLETIAPVISTAEVLPVNLNLVKREENETASVQSSETSYPATTAPEM